LKDYSQDKASLLNSFWFPLLFVAILWAVKGTESLSHNSFAHLGLYPLDFKGLRGILFAPFIHGSWGHLVNNTLPLLMLTWGLFYFYREVAYKVFFLIFFIHNFWLWFFGRDAYHIGASGIVYGLGAFLFLSGIIRMNKHLLSISLLVAFVYGSMVWGIFPLEQEVSWEAHLSGMAAGILLAVYYRHYGPPSNIKHYKNKDEYFESEDDDDENAYWKIVEDENENGSES
jgi:membrane associated rhomboid family serine protease